MQVRDHFIFSFGKVYLYQRGSQKPLIKKDRHHNGQMKKNKYDLQNTTQKTKDKATRTLLN